MWTGDCIAKTLQVSPGARRELNIFYSPTLPTFPTFPTFPTSLPKVGGLKVEKRRKSFKSLCKNKENKQKLVFFFKK